MTGRGWIRRRKPRRRADPDASKLAEWERRKKEILDRDGWRCRCLVDYLVLPAVRIDDAGDFNRCDRRDTLEVHHIRNRSQGGKDNPDNLLTLCHDHHASATERKLLYFRGRDGIIARVWTRSWEAGGLP